MTTSAHKQVFRSQLASPALRNFLSHLVHTNATNILTLHHTHSKRCRAHRLGKVVKLLCTSAPMHMHELTRISLVTFGFITFGTGLFINFTATSSFVLRSLHSHVSPVPPLPKGLMAKCVSFKPRSGTGSRGGLATSCFLPLVLLVLTLSTVLGALAQQPITQLWVACGCCKVTEIQCCAMSCAVDYLRFPRMSQRWGQNNGNLCASYVDQNVDLVRTGLRVRTQPAVTSCFL